MAVRVRVRIWMWWLGVLNQLAWRGYNYKLFGLAMVRVLIRLCWILRFQVRNGKLL